MSALAGSDLAGSDLAGSDLAGSDLVGSTLSAGFSSGVVLAASAASVGFVSVLAASTGLAASSVFAASSRTGALPVVTSDITVWPTVERSSSTPSALAVFLSKDLVSTGFASVTLVSGAPLSALSPTLVGGSRLAAGCGGTRREASIGCEKLCGVIWPGVTITRAPILVQFHILTANAIGMRMQPCEAG
ncbi:pentapeptide repeat-containing protein [Bradyrhizobium sp. CCBAU 51745]|uniref:pentapeptide repeat-containing protein n=1 Tax=Bradyrhizobium sp. CCBAU 51745 TaxID=1325099 RepID=UPI003FA4AD4D